MAEQTKPINSLVERLVRILSKRKTDDLDFTTIGVIKAFAYSQDDEGEFEYNYHKYDPSSIEDFLKTYELALIGMAVSRFCYIGTHEMFRSGRYK
ncbi:MAG: hypothetical protein ACK5FG_00385 [Chryseotalea sp.]|jgi:hypothetical protein